ncbi:hypothetical protein VTJ04DRAFT_8057 [Mycothermus thermophilus]|uniref:uncharacterized protein n=1 Tax=Humicola insolens TaxID=85995 RepID=UPI003742424F
MLMEQNEAVNGGQQQLSTVCQQPCERPSDQRAVQSRPALFFVFALSLALDHPCAPRSSGSHLRRLPRSQMHNYLAHAMRRLRDGTDGRTNDPVDEKEADRSRSPPDSIYVYACCACSEGGKGRKI